MYQRIKREGKNIKEQMQVLQIWLNDLSSKYKINNFVADISAVDYSWFRSLFLTHCDQSLNTFFLPYKCICTSNIVNVLLDLGYSKMWIDNYSKSNKYPHTHYASEDALCTAYKFIRLKEITLNFSAKR